MKNKVIARVFGGLGNQFFIYASARGLAARNGAELVLDHVSGFERDFVYQRKYMLDRFACAGRLATPQERLEPFSRLRRKWLRVRNERRPLGQRSYIAEEGMGFDPGVRNLQVRGKIFLDGYWQSEGYFEDFRNEIRSELRTRPPLDAAQAEMEDRIRAAPSVALHVRFFADYREPERRQALRDYYREAVRIGEEQLPNVRYFVFSDRPEEARSLLDLPRERVVTVDNGTSDNAAHVDLWLMSQCRNMVIADSTFSWWAAWLGEAPGSLIVAPKDALSGRRNAWGFPGLLPARWRAIG